LINNYPNIHQFHNKKTLTYEQLKKDKHIKLTKKQTMCMLRDFEHLLVI